MRVILAGFVAALIIGAVAGLILRQEQRPAWQAFASSATRVGDPGHNLVGKDWSGEPGRS